MKRPRLDEPAGDFFAFVLVSLGLLTLLFVLIAVCVLGGTWALWCAVHFVSWAGLS